MTKAERREWLLDEIREATMVFLRALDLGRNVIPTRKRLQRDLAALEKLDAWKR